MNATRRITNFSVCSGSFSPDSTGGVPSWGTGEHRTSIMLLLLFQMYWRETLCKFMRAMFQSVAWNIPEAMVNSHKYKCEFLCACLSVCVVISVSILWQNGNQQSVYLSILLESAKISSSSQNPKEKRVSVNIIGWMIGQIQQKFCFMWHMICSSLPHLISIDLYQVSTNDIVIISILMQFWTPLAILISFYSWHNSRHGRSPWVWRCISYL